MGLYAVPQHVSLISCLLRGLSPVCFPDPRLSHVVCTQGRPARKLAVSENGVDKCASHLWVLVFVYIYTGTQVMAILCIFMLIVYSLLITNVNSLKHKIWKAKISSSRRFFFFKGIVASTQSSLVDTVRLQVSPDVIGTATRGPLRFWYPWYRSLRSCSEPWQMCIRLPNTARTSYLGNWFVDGSLLAFWTVTVEKMWFLPPLNILGNALLCLSPCGHTIAQHLFSLHIEGERYFVNLHGV